MNQFSKFLAGFLFGGILGGAFALLLTPMPGSEMRGMVKEKITYVRDEFDNAAKTRSEELKLELAKLQKKA